MTKLFRPDINPSHFQISTIPQLLKVLEAAREFIRIIDPKSISEQHRCEVLERSIQELDERFGTKK